MPYGIVDMDGGESFPGFLAALQVAVAKDDRQKVADLSQFPMNTHLGAIASREQFISQYDELFGDCVRRALACNSMDDVGENWEGIWLGYGAVLAYGRTRGAGFEFYVTGFPNRGACGTKGAK